MTGKRLVAGRLMIAVVTAAAVAAVAVLVPAGYAARAQGLTQDMEERRRAHEERREEMHRGAMEGLESMRERHREQMEALRRQRQEQMEALRTEAERRQEAARKAWEERAREIRAKWGVAVEPTPYVDVRYTDRDDALSRVDYEKGFVEVEAIVRAEDPGAAALAERLAAKRLAEVLGRESLPGVRDLAEQVRPLPGLQDLPDPAIEEFARGQARESPAAVAYVAPDGVSRLRKTVRVDLMPDYLRKRAGQYLPHVMNASHKYGVAPDLVLAVMESESFFNPWAVSPVGAVGLMQLMPQFGAVDAAELVFGTRRLMSDEELFRPEVNIELGTAYLSILFRHFSRVTADPVKREYLVIAAYNWGMGNVGSAIERHGIRVEELSAGELLRRLKMHVPGETRDYLDRVVRRKSHYQVDVG